MKYSGLENAKQCREITQCSIQVELVLKKLLQVLRNYIVKHLTYVKCYSDRLIFVKICAKPVDNASV